MRGAASNCCPYRDGPRRNPASTTDFALQTLHFPVDARQHEVLATPSRRVAICCSRQWGKSTVGAIKALHHALLNPASLTLIASRTRRQAGELLDKAIGFAQTLDIPIRRVLRHPDSLLLPNHSRLIALPGNPDSLRSFSAVSLLVIDEASYVPDQLYHALRPMLATPTAASGFFPPHAAVKGFSGMRGPAKAIPGRSSPSPPPNALVSAWSFSTKSVGSTGQSYFDIDALDVASAVERNVAAQEFARGRPSNRLYCGFDLGQKITPSALAIIERISGTTNQYDPVSFDKIRETHLMVRRLERFPLHMTYDDTARRLKHIMGELGDVRDITLLLDATGCGQPFVDILRKHQLGVLLSPISITSGGVPSYANGFQRVPKKDLVSAANYVLSSGALKIPPTLSGLDAFRQEMDAFRVKTSHSGSDTFRSGQTDDLVMAFCLAAWKARQFLPVG